MSKYISLAVTSVPPYTQYIQEASIVSVFPLSNVLTELRTTSGNTFEVNHADDSVANRTMGDAITSALLDINGYANRNVATEVELPTVAGVPIAISSITYT